MDSPWDAAAATDSAVLRQLVGIIEDITDDWDEVPGSITADTRLMADLGFTSIDLVALLVAIEEHWQSRDWPYEKLLMVDGRYVDDLRVDQTVDFLHEHGAR